MSHADAAAQVGEPDVSVIMTACGEPAARIERVLAGLRRQQWGPFELVVAAPPEDLARWRDVRWPSSARTVTNPGGGRSAGLNAAWRAASGRIVCRVDARSELPATYIERCVARLDEDPGVAVVGGRQSARLEDGGRITRGIARALSNRLALGGAGYRSPGTSGPVDTVYLGAWRRDDLEAIGGFDEALEANEDFELCQRFRAEGRTVWLEPGLAVGYEPRTTWPRLAAQYFAFGRSKVRFWRRTNQRPNGRQVLALALATSALAAVGCLVPRARTRHALAALAASVLALLLVDEAGSAQDAPAGDRLSAAAAYPIIWASWTAGIGRELLRPSRHG